MRWLIAELAALSGVMMLGQMSPGPDLLLVTRTALAHGGKSAAWTSLGIACGLSIHSSLAVAGVSAVLGGNGLPGQVMRMLAGGYLLWIAWKLLHGARQGASSHGEYNDNPGGEPPRNIDAWRRGLFTNLLNPKVAVFLAAATMPFLGGPHPSWWPVAIWGVVVGQGLVLWIAWAVCLQWNPLRRCYIRSARWIDAAFGIALVALALCLAWPVLSGGLGL